MKIVFDNNHPAVKSATQMANSLLKNAGFLRTIAEHPKFDLSTAEPKNIASLLENSDLVFKVEEFTPNILQLLKYRRTFAFTDSRFPKTLFLNTKKINRETENIAATIIHESIHALDNSEKIYSFGHGDNSAIGKENTAPYWIGNLAYRVLKNDANAPIIAFDEIVEHGNIV